MGVYPVSAPGNTVERICDLDVYVVSRKCNENQTIDHRKTLKVMTR